MQGQGATGAAPALRATLRAAQPRACESAQRGRPDLPGPSTRSPRRAPFGGSQMQEGCVSPPCVGGRAGGALAKNHVDSQRRAPRLGSGGHPLPQRCAPGHRRLVHRRCRVSGAAWSCGAEAGSWQGHARMRPPSSPGLVLPAQLFGRPPRLYPGHQAAGRSRRLQRSLRLPTTPRLLAKG